MNAHTTKFVTPHHDLLDILEHNLEKLSHGWKAIATICEIGTPCGETQAIGFVADQCQAIVDDLLMEIRKNQTQEKVA